MHEGQQASARAAGGETVVAYVTRELAARIVGGRIAPGERLLQDQVAAEFGVSQVTAREAFRRLESQGLALSEPRRGVRAAPMDPAAVEEVTQMRAALEVLALRHAIPRIGIADLQAARQAIEAGEQSPDVAAWEAANRRFHAALLAPCGMPRLMAALNDLHSVSSRYLFATWQTQAWKPRSDKEHRALVDLVEERKTDAAAAALEAHILAAGEALVQAIVASGPGTKPQTP